MAAIEKRETQEKRDTYSRHGFLRRGYNFMWDSHKQKEIGGVDAAAYYPLN